MMHQLTETALFFFNLMVNDHDSSAPGLENFGVAARRIPSWISKIPADCSKSPSNLKIRPFPLPSDFSGITSSSKLTRGSTISSGGALLTPINTITNSGADNVADRFTTLFTDDDLVESVERSQALTRMSKPKAAQVSWII